MNVKVATNVNATMVAKSVSMSEDFVSDVLDFKEMIVGSVQIAWKDNDESDGEVTVEASNILDEEWFAPVNGATITLGEGSGDKKTRMFNLGVIGFRYARVVYKKGSNTSGNISILGLGKKGG